MLVTFPTDSGSFAFTAEVPVDSYEAYQEAVEAWISSLNLLDCC